MPTVISDDGASIAYERTGSGPALVLVDGADRRGRGESTDTLPFTWPSASV